MGQNYISYKFPQNRANKEQHKKIFIYQTGEIENSLEQNIFIDAVISLFFHIDSLKKFISPNKNLDLPTFKDIIMTKVKKKIKEYKRYDLIIEEILTKIAPDNGINKENYNQAQQYDEAKGLELFLESHKNANIIKKLFFIPIEEKIHCKKCNMNSYQFRYCKYIRINLIRLYLQKNI